MPVITLKNTAGFGPLIDVMIGPSGPLADALRKAGAAVPRPEVVAALLDTGSAVSLITPALAATLQLPLAGLRPLRTATTGGQPQLRARYDVMIGWTRPSTQILSSCASVVATDLGPLGVGALIGRDLLARVLLIDNGPQDEFTLSS